MQTGELAIGVVAELVDHERTFALAEQQEEVGRHPHNLVGRGEPAGGDVSAGAGGGRAVRKNACRPRRAVGGVFDGGVVERLWEQVGGGMVVDPERPDDAGAGREGAGLVAVDRFELVYVLEDGPELEAVAGHGF